MKLIKTPLQTIYTRFFEPLYFFKRWQYRMGLDFPKTSRHLSSLPIRLGQVGECGVPSCQYLIRRYDVTYSRLYASQHQHPKRPTLTVYLTATLHALVLKKIDHNVEYQRTVRKKSGNFIRNAVRAERTGYLDVYLMCLEHLLRDFKQAALHYARHGRLEHRPYRGANDDVCLTVVSSSHG